MNPYNVLEDLIEKNDIDTVKKYTQDNNLTHTGYVEYITGPGYRQHIRYPLHVAAKCGNVAILDYFIYQGFDKNYYQRFRKFIQEWKCFSFPIHVACDAGNLNVVKSLVEIHGVDVAVKDHFGRAPLNLAIQSKKLEIVKYLLEKGASVTDYCDGSLFMNPLHDAIAAQDVGITKLLLTKNVEVNDGQSYSPLARAVSHCNVTILTALLDAGAEVEGNKSASATPFAIAAINGNLEYVKLLYSRGANPEKEAGLFQCTPLDSAVLMGYYEVVRYLIVDLNLPWSDINVPPCHQRSLKLAVEENHIVILRLLLDAGFSCSRYLPTNARAADPNQPKCIADVILKHVLSSPRTLMQLCCFKVRRTLDRNLSVVVDSLPLPRALVDFVKLTHIPQQEEKNTA